MLGEALDSIAVDIFLSFNLDKIVELEKNYDDAEHCAAYEIIGYNRDQPMTEEEQKEYFTERYKNITTDSVVSYCKYCNDGVNMSDKKGLHILELLFPNDKRNSNFVELARRIIIVVKKLIS